MKTLMCSLAAILSVALGSGTVAAAEEVIVTGTVSFYEDGSMEINRGNERRPNLLGPIVFPGLKPPKEGEKVRVHGYYVNGPKGDFIKMIATKIEKVGKAEGGSSKKP
jgi:hypothetical protein